MRFAGVLTNSFDPFKIADQIQQQIAASTASGMGMP
jgi:hypothetical protein